MSDAGALLRDRFFARMREPGIVVDAICADVEAGPTTTVRGLGVSYFPGGRRKLLRFVDAGLIDAAVRPQFARPCPELPELVGVFVDPEELGYHNFENIVELGRLFRGREGARFTGVEPLADGVLRMRLKADKGLGAALGRLDALGLYARPFDPSRGGQRFIFHSAELAATLTAALREALPARLLRGFVHVNPVFRCNRFEPGDAPFAEHVDSPYHDGARQHVSKYTLLLYLTPGHGEVLSFAGGPVVRDIAGVTAVVFEQRRAHEGRPYVDGRKVFVRTELIFQDRDVEYSPGVAALFARACYLGSESVFNRELAATAHAAYDRAAAAHWREPPEAPAEEPVLLKEFHGAHFVTDGYEYWFHGLGVIECAALALLDLLNAVVGGEPFRKLCRTRVLVRGGEDDAWISAALREQARPPEPVFARLDKPALFPDLEQPQRAMDFPGSPDFEARPFPDDWDSTRNSRIMEVHRWARRWAMGRILAAPILMLGKEVFLDPEQFVVEADRIHVLSRERLGPLHFAGAQFFGPEDFIGVDVALDALRPLVPPMFFHVNDGLVHLRCDLFRNGWMVDARSERVPVPRVLEADEAYPDHTPWLNAAGLDLARLKVQAGTDG